MNQDLLYRATSLCASSEHCCHDMEEKLCKWGATDEETSKIIAYLQKEKYIDEERFSRAYARDKMRYNHWGRQKIDQGLRILHISSSLRQQALSELPEEEYLDILSSILQSKGRCVKGRNQYERNAKLIRFALGRGFEMDLIRECLSESVSDMDIDVDTFD